MQCKMQKTSVRRGREDLRKKNTLCAVQKCHEFFVKSTKMTNITYLLILVSSYLKAAKNYNISEQDAKQRMLLLQSYNLKNYVPWEVFPGKGSSLNI